jgi:uncharacterized membrane protein
LEIFKEVGIETLARYGHIIAGITWIGLLYYFNFAQTPAFAGFEAGARTEATAKLVPRAIWWFRWAAMATLAFGLLIFVLYISGDTKPYGETLGYDAMQNPRVMVILAGMLFAIVMWSNVWFVIWPAQRKAIANAQATLAGGQGNPPSPEQLRRAATASRTNTFLSIPMLFFMVVAGHLAAEADFDSSEGGKRAIWYIVIIAIAAVIEGIALKAPAAGSAITKHLDDHRNTIIGGFVLTIVLYLVFEALFG